MDCPLSQDEGCGLAAAEKSLKKINEDLQRSNRDLEQFAYIASHDLQTPLRKVKNFAAYLDSEFGDRLDDPMAQKYLKFIVQGAEQAQSLVNGLLQFSRTGRELEASCFCMKDAVDDAILILADDIADKDARIDVGALPRVRGDKVLLTRVFQNLVGNAIKFRDPGRDPEIQIRAEQGQGEWGFSVKDNGVGFDTSNATRIFDIFQRLGGHKKNGSGLGLALCKRIVERHRGRVWAESSVGDGSVFYFTLPMVYGECNAPAQ